MERERDENESGIDSLAQGTGLDRPDEVEAMRPGRDVSDPQAADEAGGDEKAAVEGIAGIGATHEAWGGPPTTPRGGIGTHVPAEGDEHATDRPEERRDSSDPRGY